MSDIRISHIAFSEDGVSIGFIDLATDVRPDSSVVRHTQFDIGNDHPDYRDAIEKLQRRAVRLVEDSMENWEAAIPFVPSEPGDDDEDSPGMGE